MARCPVCQSVRIVVVVSPQRRAFCTACGSKWIQEGSAQRAVKRGPLAEAAAAPQSLKPSLLREPGSPSSSRPDDSLRPVRISPRWSS